MPAGGKARRSFAAGARLLATCAAALLACARPFAPGPVWCEPDEWSLALDGGSGPAAPDPCGTDVQGGATDLRDLLLAYVGVVPWTADDFKLYVAWHDRSAGGVARDWFFDSFLLLQQEAPGGGTFYDTATWPQWTGFQDRLLAPGGPLSELDRAVHALAAPLGDPARRVPVVVMLPYLAATATGFGDVDGDGVLENPASEAQRIKAWRAYVDRFRPRFAAAGLRHLDLWGFYWMREYIPPEDEASVRAASAHVHAAGLRLAWIPTLEGGGWYSWRSLGIDFAAMQPGMAFEPLPRGRVLPDVARITSAVNHARAAGMGVELETAYEVDRSPSDQLALATYLNHALPEVDGCGGDRRRAWFQSHRVLADAWRSGEPEAVRLYDDSYRLHAGTYRRRALSLAEGGTATLDGRPAPELLDGLWMTRVDRWRRLLQAPAPAVVEVALPSPQVVSDVRVHLASRGDGLVTAPTRVRLLLGPGDGRFEPADEAENPSLDPLQFPGVPEACQVRAGFVLLHAPPRVASALRLELSGPEGALLGVDEVQVLPAGHLLWGAQPAVSGAPEAGAAGVSARVLVDGRAVTAPAGGGALRFAGGEAAVSAPLPASVPLASLLAHVHGPPGGPPPTARLATAAGLGAPFSPAGGNGWFSLPLDGFRSGVELRLAGAGAWWDELQVLAAPDRARGMPYRYEPPFDAALPDTGGSMLMDGRTDSGADDTRSVAWRGRAAVFVDLGAVRTPDRLRVHARGGGADDVWDPASVEVSCSTDAAAWVAATLSDRTREVTSRREVGPVAREAAWTAWRLECPPARYLRVELFPRGRLLLAELEVSSADALLCPGPECSYRLRPAPAAAGSPGDFTDESGRLTDGDHSEGRHRAPAAGLGGPDRDVVVDLLRPGPVRLVQVRSRSEPARGAPFPASLRVAVSADGASWSGETALSAPPADGAAGATAAQSARLDAVDVRFVRVRAAARGLALLEEIEVY